MLTIEEKMLALLSTKTEPQPKLARSKIEKRERVRGRPGETVTLRCR